MTGSDRTGSRSDGEHPRTWAWFRTTRDAESSPVERDFLKLPEAAQAALWAAMKRHAVDESRRKDVDHLGDGIYEIRTRIGNNHYRVLFFRWGPKLVALAAFYKNQRTTPKQDIETAKKRRTRWREAFGDERNAR
jgi:phage-related protein